MSQHTRLFVSSSLAENRLAKTVIDQLSNAFTGELRFTHAQELAAGDMWKTWIRETLRECDAGLFLVTPRYVTSQWLSAEFTAFWLSGKPIYILLFPEVEISGIFAPMRDDYQATSVSDIDGMRRFIRNLSELCDISRIPYEHTDLLSFRALETFDELRKETAPKDIIHPEDYVPDDSTFPRRHILYDLQWDLCLADDRDALKATATRLEHFICQSPVMHYVPVNVAQGANLLPFRADEGFDVELLEFEYPNGRVSISNKRIVAGGNYSFRLDFHPPLTAGAEVKVRYRFTIPALKVANREKLRELFQQNPEMEMRNYESFVIQVLNPTDVYRYTLNFAPECWVTPLPPEASWRGAPFAEESVTLLHGAYSAARDDDGGYTLQIERRKPTVHTRYTLKWGLPSRDDLLA